MTNRTDGIQKVLTAIMFTLVTVSIFSGCSKNNDKAAVEEIKGVIKKYGVAANASDLEAVLELYSSNPVFIPQNVRALVGRDAVRAGYAKLFHNLKLDIRFDIHEVEQSGDLAWVRTSSQGIQRLLSTKADLPEGNNEIFILIRENGVWKIDQYICATYLPAK